MGTDKATEPENIVGVCYECGGHGRRGAEWCGVCLGSRVVSYTRLVQFSLDTAARLTHRPPLPYGMRSKHPMVTGALAVSDAASMAVHAALTARAAVGEAVANV